MLLHPGQKMGMMLEETRGFASHVFLVIYLWLIQRAVGLALRK